MRGARSLPRPQLYWLLQCDQVLLCQSNWFHTGEPIASRFQEMTKDFGNNILFQWLLIVLAQSNLPLDCPFEKPKTWQFCLQLVLWLLWCKWCWWRTIKRSQRPSRLAVARLALLSIWDSLCNTLHPTRCHHFHARVVDWRVLCTCHE